MKYVHDGFVKVYTICWVDGQRGISTVIRTCIWVNILHEYYEQGRSLISDYSTTVFRPSLWVTGPPNWYQISLGLSNPVQTSRPLGSSDTCHFRPFEAQALEDNNNLSTLPLFLIWFWHWHLWTNIQPMNNNVCSRNLSQIKKVVQDQMARVCWASKIELPSFLKVAKQT